MEMRELGRTGIRVSAVGLGTVKIGRVEGLKHPGELRMPSDEEVVRLLERARGLGVNVLDTAASYGRSEERLGALRVGKREEWVICTKAGEEFEGGVSRFDFSAPGIRASVERSLKRLRTEYVDVALLHSSGEDEEELARGEGMGALKRLKEEGKVRAVGVSVKGVEGARAAMVEGDVVMLTLNPAEREMEGIARECGERGVGVMVKKALASGHLSRLKMSARESVGWALGCTGVSCAVVGTTREEHLAEVAGRETEGH